jgi:hypothetical protein
MGEPVKDNKLDCIVISAVKEQVWYNTPYDPDNIQDPACFALALGGDHLAPHENVPEPVAETCGECPKNKWVANPKKPGKNMIECKERRRIGVIPIPNESSEVATSEFGVLSLPPTSLKGWQVYVNQLAARGKPTWGVITTIEVKPHPKNQFQVMFSSGTNLSDDFISEVYGRLESCNDMLLAPYAMSGDGAIQGDSKDTKY